MIVTRTPFRVTLGGGGTDLPSFYSKHGGYVLAMGIDKYMYVALNVPFADRKVRLHYTQAETVEFVKDLKHELAREALLAHGIEDAIEIASLADLPAGTGLGSSSCYIVGLLTAVRAYLSNPLPPAELADEACRIELDVLKKPIGKQDQYMAATGGMTEIIIAPDGAVELRPISLPGYAVNEMTAKTHLYYTHVQRTTTDILAEQNDAMLHEPTSTVEDSLLEIKDLGLRIGDAVRAADFDTFGRLMHEHWVAKRRMSSRITIPEVEDLYEYVRSEYGVLGGKVVGAGGGGFVMLYCPNDGERLTAYMQNRGMARLTYAAEFEGSRVLANTITSRATTIHRSDRFINAPSIG